MGNQGGGIHVTDGAGPNSVGGLAAGLRNIIAFNTGHGVWVESGNQNSLLSNLIVENSLKPIFVTPGANSGLTQPVIVSATVGSIDLVVRYASTLDAIKRLQAFLLSQLKILELTVV